jgi:hypothetical protein
MQLKNWPVLVESWWIGSDLGFYMAH